MAEDSISAIGFIGTGVMGSSMASNLLTAGHTLHVYTRTKARAEAVIAHGALWCDSPAELMRHCDVVISILGFPTDVEDVYLGTSGLVAHARPGSLLIDMTTSSPILAQRIAEEAKQKGVACLDAPVSGGDIGAREGRLSIMVGGDREAFDRASPIFACLGSKVVYQGQAGSGQHTKMANQIAIASTMLGVSESLAYARRSGLDPETVLASISGGAAGSWSLSNLAPRMLAGDFDPGFFVKHFIKDMGIAIDSAREMGLDLPGLALAKRLYEELADRGHADDGTQALFRLYE